MALGLNRTRERKLRTGQKVLEDKNFSRVVRAAKAIASLGPPGSNRHAPLPSHHTRQLDQVRDGPRQLRQQYDTCVFESVGSQVASSGAKVNAAVAVEMAFQACATEEQAMFALEFVRRDHAGLHSFLSMSLIEARRRNASAFRLRFSQSLARRLHRPSHANVRSTTHRFGRTTNPFA